MVTVRKKIVSILPELLMLLSALFVISPVAVVLFGSVSEGIKPYTDFFVWNPGLVRAMCNSFIIALTVSLGSTVVSVPAAYVFAKIRFRGREILFYFYIIVMMMPFAVTLLPQYIVSREIGIYDTLLSMIFSGIFAPFSVFLLTQMMKSIPDEILEAVRMETDSTWRLLWYILVPMARPGIICAAVLVFAEYWNAVAEPLVLMESPEQFPMAVVLDTLENADAAGCAAVILFCAAPLFLFSFFEAEIIEGLGAYRLK